MRRSSSLLTLISKVKDRIRQFEAYLAHSLEAFKLRHQNEVTRIPRAIRTLTIAEFSDKYDGDVNKAIQAITKARMEASGEPAVLDGSVRKRKWQPSTDDGQEAGSSRIAKTARVASPQKKDSAGARPRLVKTPGARLRRPPPSPGASAMAKTSPSKHTQYSSPSKHRMPSNTLFNPALPKTPSYPRRPRANESLLSANGSPLTNPYESASLANGGTDSPVLPHPPGTGNAHAKLERQRSVAVLRGPSLSQPTTSQPSQAPALEVVLSIKVPTKDGNILEFDPLVTSPGDLELLEGVSDTAKKRAREELQELSGLMTRLGKWRI
ncbi:hypothetical protein JB92DRAFT_2873714 [Gautieria morchelliformis]|nr:hypothetical protein JB92DRAFT_2873714 [Gautieria morchelliformis]